MQVRPNPHGAVTARYQVNAMNVDPMPTWGRRRRRLIGREPSECFPTGTGYNMSTTSFFWWVCLPFLVSFKVYNSLHFL